MATFSVPSGTLVNPLNVVVITVKPNTLRKALTVKALPKINGSKLELTNDDTVLRTDHNRVPDLSVLLTVVTTVFLAAEKQCTQRYVFEDRFVLGKVVQAGRGYCQNFSIRSYEIGADRTTSIETLMNHLQETALNHVKRVGLLGDGFGATPEMSKKNLIWVVTKMQVLVEYYPSWGDVVEVDTWACPSGKNGMRRDWHVRDLQTGKTVMRATSLWVMMNNKTRRLSKMPEEVRAEIGKYYSDRSAILDEDNRKLPKLDENSADYVCNNLSPKWSDLDMNQHVNNVKYIGWILESTPIALLESHELASMTLEYRRECGRDSVLQSLTDISNKDIETEESLSNIQCNHMLRLKCGAEIVRGCTEWKPKRARGLGNI